MFVKLPKDEDPYRFIAGIVSDWNDEQTDKWRSDFVVRMGFKKEKRQSYSYFNYILRFSNPFCIPRWDEKWYNGQQYVDLVGITPIEDMSEMMYKL